MKVSLFIVLMLTSKFLASQEKVVRLYSGAAPGSESWTWMEKEGINPLNNTRFVYNVTTPTLTIYTPEASAANGTAVLLVPGRGMHVVLMEHEGIKTANELVKKGITVFILKYRVVQLKTANPWREMMANMWDSVTYKEQFNQVRQLAISDVKEALAYIHSHADALKLDKNRVGIIGFSAGAVMLLHLLRASACAQEPAFTGFIYGVYPPELKEN